MMWKLYAARLYCAVCDDLTIRQPQSLCCGCVVNPASDAQFVLLVGFFARLGAHRRTKTPDGCVCMNVCIASSYVRKLFTICTTYESNIVCSSGVVHTTVLRLNFRILWSESPYVSNRKLEKSFRIMYEQNHTTILNFLK